MKSIINKLIIIILVLCIQPVHAASDGSALEYIKPGKSLGIRTKSIPEALTLNGAMALTKLSSKPSASAGYGKLYVNGNNLYYNNGGSLTFLVNNGSITGVDATTLDTIDSSSFLRSDTSDSFTSGTLTFDSGTSVDINSTSVSIADTNISFDGASTTFTGTGAMTMTPGAGTNMNVSLSTTGDFAVNTSQLYVDTSAANVGVGITAPTSKLHVNGSTATKSFSLNGNTVSIPSLGQGSILFSKVAGTLAVLDNGANSNHKVLKVNGNALVWESAAGGSASAGGSNTQLQFNDSGSFSGNGALTFTKASKTLTIPSDASLDINSAGVSIADTNILFDGASTTFTGTGAMTMTPGAGTNMNVSLSTTGDFAVNTTQLYVDTSAARTGISIVSPNEKLTVNGTVSMKEGSAPSTSTGFGKVYVASSNKELYFLASDQSAVKITNNGALASVGGSSEWTETATILHPADNSGAQTVVIGATDVANGDIVFTKNGSAIFNEQSLDSDFRIEGDTEQYLFFTDASENRIAIGHDDPDTHLDIEGHVTVRYASVAPATSVLEYQSQESYTSYPSTSSSVVINRPSGVVENDFLIAIITAPLKTITVSSPPSGWTLVASQAHGVYNTMAAVYWKKATASEPGDYTFGLSGGTCPIGVILRYNGANLATPIAGYAVNSGTATDPTDVNTIYPAVGGLADNYKVIRFIASAGGGANWSLNHGSMTGQGYTSRYALMGDSSGFEIAAYDKQESTSIGAVTGSYSTTGVPSSIGYVAMTLVLGEGSSNTDPLAPDVGASVFWSANTSIYGNNGDFLVRINSDTTDKIIKIIDFENGALASSSSANTLDNIDSTSFLRSDTSDSYSSGTLTFDSGTSFVAAAGSTVDINSTAVSIADTNISFDGASTTFTGTGAMTMTPGAGTNLNVSLSGAGDFAVNTSQLYVDTSTTNTGVGTTTPRAKLEVNGAILIKDGTQASGYILQSSALGLGSWLNPSSLSAGLLDSLDSTQFLRSDTSDNFTSGTLTFDSATSLVAASGSTVDINSTAVSIADTDVSLDGASTTFTQTSGAMTMYPANGSNMNVRLDGVSDFIVDTNKLVVNNNGNVGIAYINPTYKLAVNGSVFSKNFTLNGNSFLASTLSQGSLLVAQLSGSVKELTKGANHYALKVNGNKLAWESLPYNVTNIEGLSDAKSDVYSVYLGNGAGLNDTGNTYNVGVGINALQANTTGENNSAFGYQALNSNTTGDHNLGAGYQALYSNTNGIMNTAVGTSSLYSNTRGDYNTALGYYSLGFNINGDYNTAIGHSSLYNQDAGIRNTAVGHHAGTGAASSSFSNGTFLGCLAGDRLTSGADNTFLGYSSGLNVTSGYGNLLIGYQAGDNITTGSQNIIIGYDVDASSVAASNQINIGNTFYAQINNGNIGIDILPKADKMTLNGVLAVRETTAPSLTSGYGKVYVDSTTSNLKFLDDAGTSYDLVKSGIASNIDGLSDGRSDLTNLYVGNGAGLYQRHGSENTGIGIEALIMNANGSANVGVGYQTLSSNNSGYQNIAMGTSALYYNTAGYNNVAIGDRALQKNTTANSNTAIGTYSLLENTTGDSSTAVGAASLQNNNTGSRNTAVGYASLNANTIGFYNTALGYESMKSNVDGNSNVALGYRSLFSNMIGNGNSAVGAYAMYNTDNGRNNSAFGNQALYANTSGSGNVAMGPWTMRNNTTGNGNTALGGAALYQNITGKTNTAIGYATLRNNQTGVSNTALGVYALYSAENGNSNTALGSYSMFTNISGNGNTAVGTRSLYSNTDGNWNTAMGSYTLYENTIGNGNTAVGTNALRLNTTGIANTAMGRGALFSNTTAVGNSAFGSAALYESTGSYNSAFGSNSLRLNENGEYNTAIGHTSMYASDASKRNTAVGYAAGRGTESNSFSNGTFLGYQAGFSLTDGRNNTMVGYGSGYGVTSGYGNVLVGYMAADNLTTGSNNIIIGNNINALSATDSNQLRIGNTIYGDTSTGHVSIGTSTVSATHDLQVVGTAGLSTGTAWTNTSDIRLKNIDGDYEYGLNEILKLHTVRFHYKEGNSRGMPSDIPLIGFIAQEVQKIFPEAVHEGKDGYLDFNIHAISVAMVNALQQLKLEKDQDVKELRAENEKLKQQNDQLVAYLCAKDPEAPFCK